MNRKGEGRLYANFKSTQHKEMFQPTWRTLSIRSHLQAGHVDGTPYTSSTSDC